MTGWRRTLPTIGGGGYGSSCQPGQHAELGASTCRRTLSADGFLTEIVRLDGTRGGLTDEEMETFVETFPIERI